MQPLLVCYSRDLLLESQLQGQAGQLNPPLASANSWEQLLFLAADQSVVALVDLAHPDLALEQLPGRLEELRRVAKAVVAFAPHVHTEKLLAAKAGGCDLVLSRGKFVADAASIFRTYAELRG